MAADQEAVRGLAEVEAELVELKVAYDSLREEHEELRAAVRIASAGLEVYVR